MATIKQRKRGGNWQLHWVQDGKQYRRSLLTSDKATAERYRLAKAAELATGTRIIARAPTLDDFLERYLVWYASTHPTANKARSALKPWRAQFGRLQIDALKPLMLEEFAAHRLRTLAPETVGKELRTLKASMVRAVKWGETDINPFANVDAPRGVMDAAVEWYEAHHLAALYAANPNRAHLWRFLANTGLRRAEALKAKRTDIHAHSVIGSVRAEQILRVESTEAGRTKSGKWREVPLNDAAVQCLTKMGADRLFPNVHMDTLSKMFARDAAKAGVGGSIHKLRHTFCSHLVAAGVPLRVVQALAGHSSITVTERYSHLAPASKLDAVKRMAL
jgi:integrase